jgi:1-acyl-sn-glycerol-3-phosphate acyltransferase
MVRFSKHLTTVLMTTDSGNIYKTAPNKRSFLSKIMPSPYFYMDIANLIWTSGHYAKHNDYTDERWLQDSYRALRVMERSGMQVQAEGLDILRNLDEPVVFIGNHMSTLETFVLPAFVRPHMPVTFVIKKVLVDYPVFKWVMRSRDPIVVGRGNPKEDYVKVMKEGAAHLSKGTSVIVFPQTTRAIEFEPEHFNTIGVKLAKRAGVKIVPIALKTDAWSPGKLVRDMGRIHCKRPVCFRFGEPMEVEGNGKVTHEKIADFIQSSLNEWK